MQIINIEAKNGAEEELLVKKELERVLEGYPRAPIFTDRVVVDQKAIPHSHPILTLGTKEKEPLLILKTFVHEQFHWFEASRANLAEAVEYLKINYENLGDCDKGGKKTDSFWIHLIVCWNTRNFLQNNLNKEEIAGIYNSWQVYPLTEKFVAENFKKIEADLLKYDMVWRPVSYGKI